MSTLAGGKRIKRRKKETMSGKVLSMMRANGEWMAVVQAFRSYVGDPIVSRVVPIGSLTGAARRKADRWVEWLK